MRKQAILIINFKHGFDSFTYKHCEILGAQKCSKIRKLLVWKTLVLTHSHISIAKFQVHKNAQKYENYWFGRRWLLRIQILALRNFRGTKMLQNTKFVDLE